MDAKDYWGYWVNVVQELRVKVKDLESQIDKLNKKLDEVPRQLASIKQGSTTSGPALSEKELTACMALKEIGKPASVDEINAHLRKSRRIDESIKETLFLRLKGALEKGYVAFDQESKTFRLTTDKFVVA